MTNKQSEISIPTDFSQLYPGRFIKSKELKGKRPELWTIKKVWKETLTGKDKPSVIISFHETDQHWMVVKTNGLFLKELFGDKVTGWIGRKLWLFAMKFPSQFGDTALRIWGTPELPEDRNVTIQLPTQGANFKNVTMKMHKTLPTPKSQRQQQSPPPQQPINDPGEYGHLPGDAEF